MPPDARIGPSPSWMSRRRRRRSSSRAVTTRSRERCSRAASSEVVGGDTDLAGDTVEQAAVAGAERLRGRDRGRGPDGRSVRPDGSAGSRRGRRTGGRGWPGVQPGQLDGHVGQPQRAGRGCPPRGRGPTPATRWPPGADRAGGGPRTDRPGRRRRRHHDAAQAVPAAAAPARRRSRRRAKARRRAAGRTAGPARGGAESPRARTPTAAP